METESLNKFDTGFDVMKSITINKEVYDKLVALKGFNESFSDTISRIIGNNALFRLAGTLSNDEAKEIRANIKKIRKEIDSRVMKTVRRMNK